MRPAGLCFKRGESGARLRRQPLIHASHPLFQKLVITRWHGIRLLRESKRPTEYEKTSEHSIHRSRQRLDKISHQGASISDTPSVWMSVEPKSPPRLSTPQAMPAER